MRYVFEDFVLDTDRRELKRGRELIAIGPQVFDLLVYLVKNRERVVTKDDLFEEVWGGRIVSESTLTSHINAVRKAVADSGEEQRLIRTIARKGFRFVGEPRQAQAPSDTASHHDFENAAKQAPKPTATLALPSKPSIAVLPFQNLSGDPDQEYFADGVVEDIITALSRMRWLFVIARNSSFTYKGRPVDVKQVGRELGVRYVLEGSVRKAVIRVRITGQLVDASTGAHIWADYFDGSLDDIFDLQDRVTASVVGAIAPRLEQAEIERAKHKPTDNLDAYDYFLRGMASFYRWTKDATDEALKQFYEAIERDPDFAAAYALAAWCYVWRKVHGWMNDRAQEIAEGARLARRAVKLGKDDAVALARGGHAIAHLDSNLDGGIDCIDRALILNPNLAVAWYLSGWLRAFRGEPELAIEHLARAMRLSPLDPTLHLMQAGTGFGHFIAGRFDDASSWAEKACHNETDYAVGNAVLAVSHALAGRLEVARQAMARLRQVYPALCISNIRDWLPIRQPENFARWTEGLRKAGLPE